MPLIKPLLRTQIAAALLVDPKLKSGIISVSTKAMNAFQISLKASVIAGGPLITEVTTQAAASLAFANEMRALQPFLSEAISDAVADAVDIYVKSATVIIPPPLLGPPVVVGGPIIIPLVPPGNLI